MKSFQEDPVVYPKFINYCDKKGLKLGDTINLLIQEFLVKNGVILEPTQS